MLSSVRTQQLSVQSWRVLSSYWLLTTTHTYVLGLTLYILRIAARRTCAYACSCFCLRLCLCLHFLSASTSPGEWRASRTPKTSLWQSHLYGKGNSDLKGAIRSQNQNHFRKRQQKLGKSAGIWWQICGFAATASLWEGLTPWWTQANFSLVCTWDLSFLVVSEVQNWNGGGFWIYIGRSGAT